MTNVSGLMSLVLSGGSCFASPDSPFAAGGVSSEAEISVREANHPVTDNTTTPASNNRVV